MGFIDKKTRVIDVILTERGRQEFSEGNLDISYYAFSDDFVDYREMLNGAKTSGSIALGLVKTRTLCEEAILGEGDNSIKHFIFDSNSETKPMFYVSENSITLENYVKRSTLEDLVKSISRGESFDVTFLGIEKK